ncbi:MAG: apolipoprotein N-acyltransferase, partial [Acidimicrobiales bacterium]
MRGASHRAAAAAGLVGGLGLTAGLPPFGWWPLALAGSGLVAWAVRGRGWGGRALAGGAAGLAFLGPGLLWMAQFHAVGFTLAVVVEVTLFTAGVVAVPPRRWPALGFPAGLVLAEALRGVVPFGGVPIATLAQTQVGGPLAPASRLGGGLVVAALVGLAGVGLAGVGRRRAGLAGVGLASLALATVATVAGAGALAPRGRASGSIDVALVQGGGERGTRAADTPVGRVLDAHLAASRRLRPGDQDLVVWPEDVVDAAGQVTGTPTGRQLAGLARRLRATLVVGLVEGDGDGFRNLAVAWGPDGEVLDSYEKHQRVPFGEYIPLRSVLERVVDLGAVPRDARVGEGPGSLVTPAGDLGVALSYEVFFPRRLRDALAAGAEVVLVPTNASSFSTTQMPALELGAARLRALETGRVVLQAAPTGFSAVIGPDGEVRRRSHLGQRTILRAPVELRRGTTPYARLGDGPFVAAAAAALAGA